MTSTALRHPLNVTSLQLVPMPPDDIEERRDTPTLEAPPPSDTEPSARDTQPPDPIAEAGMLAAPKTMLPADPRKGANTPSYFEEAAKNFGEALIELRLTRKEIATGFTSQGGKLDEMTREFNTNYGLLSGEFKSFRAVVEARLDDGERRFDEIEDLLRSLKKEQLDAAGRQIEAADKITRLEIELAQLRTHINARSAS